MTTPKPHNIPVEAYYWQQRGSMNPEDAMTRRSIGGDPDGKFHIYLGTFGDQRSIQALKKQPLLQDKTFKSTMRKVSSEVLWYRVTAGGFQSKEEALQALRGLKQQGVLPAFPASSG